MSQTAFAPTLPTWFIPESEIQFLDDNILEPDTEQLDKIEAEQDCKYDVLDPEFCASCHKPMPDADVFTTDCVHCSFKAIAHLIPDLNLATIPQYDYIS